MMHQPPQAAPPSGPPPLERRTPGSTDTRMFTHKVLPAGRHSILRGKLRVVRDQDSGRPSLARLVTFCLAAVLVAAGCSAGDGQVAGPGGATATAAVTADSDLSGVCPTKIVVQASWYTQVEHFAAYQLLGAGYTVDADHKRVTGPLVSGGRDTGVDIEIRAGGPAIGYQQVSAQMYADRSITFGMLALDESIQNAKDQPTVGVMAPYDVDPLILMWDPKRHPEFNAIADIGQSDTKVLYFQGESSYMDHLTATGVLRKSQVDGSYDGTPSRLVAARGDLVVQGFATSEPWKWLNEVPEWGRHLEYQLVSDAGYPGYRNMLAVRTGDKQALDGCLRRLVPMFQRATVEFMAKPAPTVSTILTILAMSRQDGYTDSVERSAFAVREMRDRGLVGNGKDTTIGEFDLAPTGRVGRMLNILRPVFAAQRKPVPDGLTGGDVVTNDYIDPAIGLPPAPAGGTPTPVPTSTVPTERASTPYPR